MELTTLIGLLIGVGAVLGAMFFKGVPYSAFWNPAALLIIFAGTASSVITSFPGRDLSKLGKLFGILFSAGKTGREKEIIDTFMELAVTVRKEGLISIEGRVAAIDDLFMQKALKMIIDGAESDYVLEVLSAEIEAMEERHAQGAEIFTSAGKYAPTLGVLGAVFGLIAAMQHIDDVELMSHAIAAAFMATILGIFTGYVVWNPFATKLKMKTKHEVFEKTLIIEGVLSIQKGEQPARIKEKLVSMLPSVEQAKYNTD